MTDSRKLSNDELNRLSVNDFKSAAKTKVIVILDDVRSLHNIGSVFRTADAFLIEKIFLCGISATPPNKEIHKTALGATETVDWEYRKELLPLLGELRDQNVEIYAIEQVVNSIPLHEFAPDSDKTYALIFGNEVFGVNPEAVTFANGAIEIPQFGSKHSLNISVSAGLVLWDFFRQLQFHR